MLIPLDQRYKEAVGCLPYSTFLNNIPCEYYKVTKPVNSVEPQYQANVATAFAINSGTISVSINRKYHLAIDDTDNVVAIPVYRKDRTISKFVLKKGESDVYSSL